MNRKGFSLLELLMVVALLAIVAGVSVSLVGTSADGVRYEETRAKMEKIRVAILGDASMDAKGRRMRFGFHGDYGSLPASLSNLTTQVGPAWAFDATEGIGAGWRGPYITTEDAGAEGILKDRWGNAFVWSPGANPPTLTSYGSDGVAGGSVYAKDIVMTFPAEVRLSTVHGFAMDDGIRAADKTVELRYSVSGAVTMTSATTDSNGAFSFSNVPFGYVSLRVTGTPALGPQTTIVDSVRTEIPTDMLDFDGSAGRVTYNAESFSATGSGDTNIKADLSSTYATTKTLDYLTVYWDRPGTTTEGYLTRVTMNGKSQDCSNNLSGDRIDITGPLTMPANNSKVDIRMEFAQTGGDGKADPIDQSDTTFTCIMEWEGSNKKDSVTFP